MSEPPSRSSSDASSIDEAFQFSEMTGSSSDTGNISSSPTRTPSSNCPTSSAVPASCSPQTQTPIRSSPPISTVSPKQAQSSMQPPLPPQTSTPISCRIPPLPSSVQACPSMGTGYWVPAQSSMGPPVFVPENYPKHLRPSITPTTVTIPQNDIPFQFKGSSYPMSTGPIIPLPPQASIQRSCAKNQKLRDKFEEFATKFWPSPRHKPNSSFLMQDMCFTADFSDIVDAKTIRKNKLSGLLTESESRSTDSRPIPPTPLNINGKRKWSSNDYPTSFLALCRQLWVIMLQTKEFSQWLNPTITLLKDLRNVSKDQTFEHIRAVHAHLINQVELILSGEDGSRGQIAYPNIKVPSPRLWSLLNEVFTEHGVVMDYLLDVRELATARWLKMEGRRRQGQNYTFTNLHCLKIETELQQLEHRIVEGVEKLAKMHWSFGYSFRKLIFYLVSNMSHVPNGGPLFEEERWPAKQAKVFEGYAMDVQVESLDWMKCEDGENDF